jgi:hypothetical protein
LPLAPRRFSAASALASQSQLTKLLNNGKRAIGLEPGPAEQVNIYRQFSK